ncbi:hypothetical protein JTB14_010519 [Gonioctena quinquepunctata]|nr:hypothetical protein JTB14_010519 [Gonioctena quinquepunctata]
MEWNLDDPKQAEEALKYLFSLPENEADQLDALDTESAIRSGRNISSAASSTSSIFTNSPVTVDYNLDETLADETLAKVVPDSQACDKTEHNLSPDVPNNSEIGEEVPVKEPLRVEGTADKDDNLEWLEGSEYFDKLSLPFDKPFILHISACLKEISFVQEIFNDDLFSLIVQQINLDADQISKRNWSPLSTPELKAYIGCLILIGIHKLPRLEHYWSSNPLLRVDKICDVMNSKRFKKITEALHCNNNESCPARGSPQN